MMAATYPHLYHFEIANAPVLPIGTGIVKKSPLDFLYFTFPYLDDAQIYNKTPQAQIETPTLLIQTYWIIPIYRSEANFIRDRGPQAFENAMYAKQSSRYDGYNFFRPAYI